jgi:hypothetical protein
MRAQPVQYRSPTISDMPLVFILKMVILLKNEVAFLELSPDSHETLRKKVAGL